MMATCDGTDTSTRDESQNGNEKALMATVRQQFKQNMKEVDDEKIKEQKEAAIRALHNLHLLEAERYVKSKK